MAIHGAGTPIKFSELAAEYGGTAPHSMSEYYRNVLTTSNNTGVPLSGPISISQFYNTTKVFVFTVSTNTNNLNVGTAAIAAGWDGITPLVATIATGVKIGSASYLTPSLTISHNGITLINDGKIMGAGGRGSTAGAGATAGGTAILTTVNTSITLGVTGLIYGGGGGGGAGTLGVSWGYAGGGGAGIVGGAGGVATGYWLAGAAGTETTGGGGAYNSATIHGGTGGGPGLPGDPGIGGYVQGPGAAGNSVVGNSLITWTNGTPTTALLGPVVA